MVVLRTHADTQKPQLISAMETRQRYIYIEIGLQLVSRWASRLKRLNAHTYIKVRDGDSTRSTRAFRRVEVAFWKPALSNYRGTKTEEKGSVPIRQHFVFAKRDPLSQYLSLSFIAQVGRLLQPVASSQCSVLSDRDTPQFLPNECVLPRISLQPTCTYLCTIQQKLCPRVRDGSCTLFTDSA